MEGIITYEKCPLCESEKIKHFQTVKDYSFSQEDFELYRCNGCYFVFTQHVPDQNHIGRYYQSENYVSHTDTRKGIFFKFYHMARAIMLKRKQKSISPFVHTKNPTLLDIGAATGYFLNHMKENGYAVTGVETDPDARAFCKRQFNIESSDPEVFFKQSEEKFDVITMWHVLEHVHNLHQYIDELHNKLNDNGVVVIAVPNHDSTDRRFFKQYWAAYDIPVHLWHFAPDTIAKLFAEHNFKLVAKKSMPFDAFYISVLSWKAKKNPLYLLLGFVYGMVPFINQLLDVNKSSSVTYFFQKK